MPRKSRLNLPPLNLGPEPLGQRIARLRKERGYTQVALAEKIGLVQNLISVYESDQLRMTADMVVRFARALEVSADELLGLHKSKSDAKPSLKILRRLTKIQSLPPAKQKAVLKTLDMLLESADHSK